MHAWSQLTSLGLAGVGFLFSVWPRTEPGNAVSAFSPAARLARFPVFWAGLALLAYVAIQGLNPAWRFTGDDNAWWIDPVPHLSWLPSGVEAPFLRSSPWRALTVYGSLWLLVCSVWVGFSRRRSYQILFTVISLNAFFLSLLGLLQKLSLTDKIFWHYAPSNPAFIASFIYPNHGGAYFNLALAVTAGLSWWHYQRACREREKPGLAAVFIFFGVCIALATVLSSSRMSIILLLAFSLTAGGLLLLRFRRREGPIRHRREILPAALALAGFCGVGLLSLRTERTWERFAAAAAHPAASAQARLIARRAAGEMLRDRWWFGWGAGCFAYNFPAYARKYPEIYYIGNGHRQFWEHAHDDFLEFPVELGMAGLLPLLIMLGWYGRRLGRGSFGREPAALFIVLGCGLTTLHAAVDFVFQNPAVLLTWGVLLVGAMRWTEFHSSGGRGRFRPGTPPNRDAGGDFRDAALSGPILPQGNEERSGG